MYDNAVMAKKKDGSNEKYRKPARMVRIREALAKQGDALAELEARDLTEIVNEALREKLERKGMWPVNRPPPPTED